MTPLPSAEDWYEDFDATCSHSEARGWGEKACYDCCVERVREYRNAVLEAAAEVTKRWQGPTVNPTSVRTAEEIEAAIRALKAQP